MAIAIDASEETAFPRDRLSGTSRVNVIDRWIYVFTAASLIAIVLAGFVPDSLSKVAAIQAGQRLPFPLVLHIHAILMGSFLLLLLGQTVLMATGKRSGHMQLGIAVLVLTPMIVITGFILAPTIYHSVWNAAQAAPPPAKQQLQGILPVLEDIRWAGQRVYEELLTAGVRIYEYQPTFSHTKLLVKDGAWSVIGSANMDIRSRRLNDEVMFGIQDQPLAQSLHGIFQKDLLKSKPIKLEDWKRRGLLQRLLEILSQAFVQQY